MLEDLHCIWILLSDDADFSIRWNLLKGHFSRTIDKGKHISKSHNKRRERRFWTYLLVDQIDFNNYANYIYWNSVKHGWVRQVADWRYLSFHKFVKSDIYPHNWGYPGEFTINGDE